jgi:hypothetical protein
LVFAIRNGDAPVRGAVIRVIFDEDVGKDAINATVAAKLGEICQCGTENISLLADIGIPDIRIVIEKGEVGAVYVRNCDADPAVEVVDMDLRISNPFCEMEFMREYSNLDAVNEHEGFRFVPHLAEDRGF